MAIRCLICKGAEEPVRLACAMVLQSAFVLSFDALVHSLPPEQYDYLFTVQDDDLHFASVSSTDKLIGKAHFAVGPKEECERLISDHSSDSRRKAALMVFVDTNNQSGNKKR